MKVILLKNKISDSLKSKLDNVSKWFSPVIKLEFTEERTSFNFPNGDYSYTDQFGQLKTFKAVDETWYDENISKPARDRGFDIAIFMVKSSSWLSSIVEGFGTSEPDFFVEEITMKYFTSGTYDFNGVKLQGDKLEWIIIHELLHRLYNKLNLEDNTHKYFSLGTPEKCLEDFKVKTWKHFKLSEKSGQLGHTVADLDTKLVDMLDELRGRCGFPFVITSGYRTPEENAKIKGSVAGSAHTKRLAVDIACTDSKKRIKIVGEAYAMGFIGIGIDKSFVHLDIMGDNKRIWLY